MSEARSACLEPAARLEAALSGAHNAMNGGAWEGGTSDDFSAELDGYRRLVNDAGPAALEEFDDASSRLPAMVDGPHRRRAVDKSLGLGRT